MLSDQEIKYLMEKGESCIDSKDFKQALTYYNQVIKNTPPNPFFFKRRGFCHRMMENMDVAIDNYSAALELDPDDGVTYWERGACYNDKPFLEKIEGENKKFLLEKALKDYKYSLQRIPTSEEAWLALIDIYLCLLNFDAAISIYGECKPYIKTKEYKVIRSWYGCLALIFAGDSIEEDDEKFLNDSSVRLKWYHWAFYSIDTLFKELEQINFNKNIIAKAREIHHRFIDHFDDQPLSFSKNDK